MTLQDKIINIEQEIKNLNIELKQIKDLVEILPDLCVYENRYCDIYISNSIEPTEVDFYCYENSINVRFYSIINTVTVYKCRSIFYLGRKNISKGFVFEGSIVEDPNWEKNLKNYNIPQKLIVACRKYIDEYVEDEKYKK